MNGQMAGVRGLLLYVGPIHLAGSSYRNYSVNDQMTQ